MKKTPKRKTTQVKRRGHKMSVMSEGKERIILSCTEEEKMHIKILAAREKKTMSEYLLSAVRGKMPKCSRSHVPNKETEQVLKDTDEGKNLIEHKTLDDFWEALGFNEHADA